VFQFVCRRIRVRRTTV